VQRVKDNEDRRVSRVVPTSEGQKLIEEISSQASSKFLSDSILSMDEDLVDKLLISLEALMETMKKSEKGI
ncbi:MAG: MarR family transcriptional regulator, partial [Bacillota bacterium]